MMVFELVNADGREASYNFNSLDLLTDGISEAREHGSDADNSISSAMIDGLHSDENFKRTLLDARLTSSRSSSLSLP